ncbi:MAG: hypothetical protein ABEL76_04885, partial [Bradymonadaceae bacterium]
LVLPAGSYKVFVHGEDAKRDQVWTDEHRERVKVEVEKGVVLARYGIVGLIVAAGLFLLFASGGRGSDTFVSGSSDAELDVDFDAGADGDEF